MAKKYLIVEGYYDYLFYTSLFYKISINDIQIIQPKDYGCTYNGKGNCINLLGDLIKQFNDGSASRLAIIVDADYTTISNQGFHNTLTQVNDKLQSYGYNIQTASCNYSRGIIFNNSNGLPDIALWIMPDNSNEGYLEYLLLDALKLIHSKSIKESQAICSKMTNKIFPAHHLKKSELAVFMAMQENPGRNITHLIEKDLIDVNKFKNNSFCNFIFQYFS